MSEIFSQVYTFVVDLIQSMRITDLIDMTVLALLFYQMLQFLRKTSSGRVMRGVVVLMIALALSSTFDLYALSYLINRAMEWGILALVILFQPEIRRFLERVGSSSLGLNMLTNFSRPSSPQDIELAIVQTVEAYTQMSRDKVGALMVFERKNLLDEIIKTGTSLDCAISSELLKNVFWNKAPLHDGAVIVREGRIVGAGCMLPLSGNVNLSRDLGMRHRAGIGISEHSDAIVVLVSEETGSISAAIGGMLKRHLAPETLERLLCNELLPEQEADKQTSFPVISNVLKWGKKGDTVQ